MSSKNHADATVSNNSIRHITKPKLPNVKLFASSSLCHLSFFNFNYSRQTLKLITKNSRTVGGPPTTSGPPSLDAAATPSLRHCLYRRGGVRASDVQLVGEMAARQLVQLHAVLHEDAAAPLHRRPTRQTQQRIGIRSRKQPRLRHGLDWVWLDRISVIPFPAQRSSRQNYCQLVLRLSLV